MKVFKRKTFATLMMSSILLLQSLSPLLAVATTVETETTEATTSSEQSSETSAPATEQSTEEPPAEPVYTEVEKNYEDKKLSSDYQEQSAQLAVQFTKKELTKEVTLEGEILSGIEQQEGQRTETRLTKFLLQKKEKDTWEDVQSFVSKKEEEQTIQDQAYTFAYSETLKKGGVYQYRFVVDYEVQRYEEEQLKEVDQHKAHYSIGEVKVEEETTKSSEKKTQTTTSSEIGPQKEKPAKKQKSAASIQPFSGIGPQAAGNDVEHRDNGTNSWVKISSVKKNKAQFSFNYASGYTFDSTYEEFLVVWNTSASYVTNVIGAHTSGTPGKSNLPIGIYNQFLSEGNASTLQVAGDGGSRIWTTSNGNMTGLIPSKKYYVWIFSKTYFPGNGVIPAQWSCRWHTAPVGPTGQAMEQFDFETAHAIDTYNISKPTFSNPTSNSIYMENGTYKGDISETEDGIVEINNGSTVRPIGGITHDISTDGKYYGKTLTGLDAGTKYWSHVILKNYYEDDRSSGWTTTPFYTKNTVSPPGTPTKNKPETVNSATASFTASYQAGNAHPNAVEVQYSTNNSTWTTINTSTTPAVAASSIKTSDKTVSFTLSKLNAKTGYYVRFRVRNDGNLWSDYSGGTWFQTNGIKLKINPPKFRQSSAGPDRIYMEPNGSYTGDAWHVTNQGKVLIKPAGGSSEDKIINLNHYPHATERRGTYSDATLYGLSAGTKYQAQVGIKDSEGSWVTSTGPDGLPGWSGADGTISTTSFFYTANTVKTPENVTPGEPTGADKATATVTAEYGASAGVAGADPSPSWNNVRVEISTTSATTGFNPVTSSSTVGKLSGTPSVNTSNKRVTFTISDLATKTQYWIRCSVKNQSGNWSAYPVNGAPFKTKAMGLKVNAPKFDQSTATAESILMTTGGYTGDIWPTNGLGVVGIKPYGGSHTNKITNLTYSNTTSGSYWGRTVTNLEPGTKYQGQVGLLDYNGTWQTSGRYINGTWKPIWSGVDGTENTYFYTVNKVEKPDEVTVRGTPTENDNATATVTTEYKASMGSAGADPTSTWSDVKVEISTTSSTTGFSPLSAVGVISGPRLAGTPSVDTSGKKVSVNITNLEAKKQYWVRCIVKNQSGQWSEYPSEGRGFMTKGIDLTFTPPVLDQSSATTTSINMKGQQYFGDITQVNNQGAVLITSLGHSDHKVVQSGFLGHTLGRGEPSTPNNKYNDYLIQGLTPGTQYKAQVHIKNFDGDTRSSQWSNQFAYTKNTIDNLTSHVPSTPTAYNNATATFTAGYQAGGNPLATITEVPAHPTKVNVYLSTDGLNYDLLDVDSSASGPRLFRDDDINTSGKTSTFKIEGLLENTHYYVKYSVINGGGESPLSAPYDFTTLTRPDGLYINERPAEFDFGTVGFSSNNSTHPLEDTSGNETAVDFENINVNSNWSLSAKLSELEVDGESHLKLVGSSITLNNQLKETTDGGTTWTPADPAKLASGVNTTGPITLLADDSTSVELFKTADIPYGQSRFRNIIPLSSVSLFIPGNQGVKGKEYEGHITWTLNATA